MEKEAQKLLKEKFDAYKAEYSQKDTKEERKSELISLMQNNLKERSGKDHGTIDCFGSEHSLDSTNVEDLYTIDGALNAEYSKKRLTEAAEIARHGKNNATDSKL